MPYTFLTAGIVLIIAGVRGTQDDLFALLSKDFTGSPSFLPWIVSILLIGALGYIGTIRPFSRAFLALVIVALFLSNGGFFEKLKQGIPEAFSGAKQ